MSKRSDLLRNYLGCMFHNKPLPKLDEEELGEEFADFGKELAYFAECMAEFRDFSKALAKGDLNFALPATRNELASSLKTVHANLKHMTWQAQRIAKGDYNQRVDYLGDFSTAFNTMTEQLAWRQESLEESNRLLGVEKEGAETAAHWYGSVLDAIPLPVSVTDADMNWTYVNAAAERFLGKKRESVLGSPCSAWDTEICGTEQCGIACVKRGQAQTFYAKDESSYQVDTSILSDIHGDTAGFIEVVQDVTEVKRLATERTKAEEASAAKSAFLATMSHEIRTPMNAIIGMAQLAMYEEMNEAAREHIFTIKHAGENLLSIVNDILDFSKIESGQLEIQPVEYLFSSLINDVISIIKMQIRESRLRFVVDVDCNIPHALYGDVTRVRQIMMNLLSNAVKYTENGYVSFTVSGRLAGEGEIDLVIAVEDSGIGIKEEDMSSMFEKFTRFDLNKNATKEGTGLGLAITHSLIKSMDGEISVESEYGKGSLFTAVLPQKIRSQESLAKVEDPGSTNTLIFERRKLSMDSTARAMENLGIRYKLVSTADEFFSEFLSGQYTFVFIASILYYRYRESFSYFETNASITLIAELGDTVNHRNVNVITTPVYSIPIANILNGVTDDYYNITSADKYFRFVAPDACVLVVDDINTNLRVAQGLMAPYKMLVDVSVSGADAIRAVKAARYDLVFMDHMMPEMDGIETVARIRKLAKTDPYFETLPIIALTANAVAGSKKMFIQNGFNDFLSKPIDVFKLNSMLEKWLPKDKQQKSADEIAVQDEDCGTEIFIEGVDVKRGIGMTGGTLQGYLDTLKDYHADGVAKMNEITQCIESDDIALYTIYVHALKSVSASIGASALSKNAADLEAAGKRGDRSYIKMNTERFLRDLGLLLDNIYPLISKEDTSTSSIEIDKSLLKTELENLKTALEDYDAAAVGELSSCLEKYLASDDIGDTIDAILQKKMTGEYEEAVELIEALLT